MFTSIIVCKYANVSVPKHGCRYFDLFNVYCKQHIMYNGNSKEILNVFIYLHFYYFEHMKNVQLDFILIFYLDGPFKKNSGTRATRASRVKKRMLFYLFDLSSTYPLIFELWKVLLVFRVNTGCDNIKYTTRKLNRIEYTN